jgi:hypothetical protein
MLLVVTQQRGTKMLRKFSLICAIAAAVLFPMPTFAGHGHGHGHGLTGMAITGMVTGTVTGMAITGTVITGTVITGMVTGIGMDTGTVMAGVGGMVAIGAMA